MALRQSTEEHMGEPTVDPGTELRAAAARGSDEVVGRLLSAGAPIDAADEHGWTALSWAAAGDHLPVLSVLLDRGAAVDDAATDGRTAFDIALAAGSLAAARALRDRGARVRSRPYTRAYPVEQLWAYPDWRAEVEPGSVVFVHDDLSVTRTMWPGEEVLLADESPAWRAFCADVLGFAAPDDLELAEAASLG